MSWLRDWYHPLSRALSKKTSTIVSLSIRSLRSCSSWKGKRFMEIWKGHISKTFSSNPKKWNKDGSPFWGKLRSRQGCLRPLHSHNTILRTLKRLENQKILRRVWSLVQQAQKVGNIHSTSQIHTTVPSHNSIDISHKVIWSMTSKIILSVTHLKTVKI